MGETSKDINGVILSFQIKPYELNLVRYLLEFIEPQKVKETII